MLSNLASPLESTALKGHMRISKAHSTTGCSVRPTDLGPKGLELGYFAGNGRCSKDLFQSGVKFEAYLTTRPLAAGEEPRVHKGLASPLGQTGARVSVESPRTILLYEVPCQRRKAS
jgi:hypothetical protein